MQSSTDITVGGYLASRLVAAGCNTFFTVPGDFTLSLLDELLRNPSLTMIGTCNELNAGYAADGYARSTGALGAVVVTYMVGGLSLLNAAAGAMAENIPLLIVSGGPNSNDYEAHHLLHHTIGETDFYQSSKCFEPVVAGCFVIKHINQAAKLIDEAFTICLSSRKPVYLEIACNLATCLVVSPSPISFTFDAVSDPLSLQASVEHAAQCLQGSNKPVLIAGSQLHVTSNAINRFRRLAATIGCAVGTIRLRWLMLINS